ANINHFLAIYMTTPIHVLNPKQTAQLNIRLHKFWNYLFVILGSIVQSSSYFFPVGWRAVKEQVDGLYEAGWHNNSTFHIRGDLSLVGSMTELFFPVAEELLDGITTVEFYSSFIFVFQVQFL
ncbi:hypothetical protein ACJX0J_007499, partial [Zea mays]